MLRGDRDGTIRYIICEYSKLKQKRNMTIHGKVIHLELCKKLKFDHKNKWYKHSPQLNLENETHKSLWDFEIQTEKKSVREGICCLVDFTVWADHRVKTKRYTNI